jgi:hypothetical protein
MKKYNIHPVVLDVVTTDVLAIIEAENSYRAINAYLNSIGKSDAFYPDYGATIHQPMKGLIDELIKRGFESHEQGSILSYLEGGLSISIRTDYNTEFLWAQFRYKEYYNTENSLSDSYVKTFAEYETSKVEYLINHGEIKEKSRIAKILGL